MSVIRRLLKDERGGGLLITLLFIVFLGIIGVSMATLVVADTQMQVLNVGKRRAFYAAQSGIEYGIRGIMEYAVSNSSLNSINNYSETVQTGGGSYCIVRLNVVNSTTVSIEATGYSQNFAETIEKEFSYIDVSYYAIYTTGEARYIRTIPSGRIRENATHMPLFDHDELRDLARPTQYFTGNLNLNWPFVFTRDITYVEGNLSFGRFNWANRGNFVARGNVRINTSWLPLGFTVGTIYQPVAGRTFQCQWQLLWRELNGGLITNGDITGTSRHWWPFRFTVRHNRNNINDLLQYTVNGGPLIITGSTWENSN